VAKQTTTQRRPNLTQTLIKEIRHRITSGILKPGDKLPTEQKLVEEFGVSRTVIREAVAGLRADKLVEARHGVGVFVLDPPKPSDAFHYIGGDSDRVSTIVEALELRAAVEVEAAAIAAERCSPGQEARIRESYQDMIEAPKGSEEEVESDFAFHIAIADATNNSQFPKFLEFLGGRTIPRSQITRPDETEEDALRRGQRLNDEHRAIMEAICNRDPEAAREAMRTHLKGSQERYHRLISPVD
jgi:GntR family transcriptional repressor for pyruvate dehydrogenase complex